MKTSKWFFALIIGVLLISGSCSKDEVKGYNAIITGWDARKCACCGGLMVTFTKDAVPYSAEFKLIQNYKELNIGPESDFPIYVEIEYADVENTFCKDFIRASKLKIIK